MNKHEEFTLLVIHRVVLFIARKYWDGDRFTHEMFTNPTIFTQLIFQLKLWTQHVL